MPHPPTHPRVRSRARAAAAIAAATATAAALLLPALLLPAPADAAPPHAHARAGVRQEANPKRARGYDVKHIKAELRVDVDAARVEGAVTHELAATLDDLDAVVLDCGPRLDVATVNLDRVRGAAADEPVALAFEHDKPNALLRVKLERPRRAGETFAIRIAYAGSPRGGLTFVKPNDAQPDLPVMVWSQGQAEDNHLWLPCHDHPNDMATVEMIVTVPAPYSVLSNGSLRETVENPDGSRTFHWLASKPFVSYLVTLVVGEFNVYRDYVGDLPVEYYVAKNVDEATARAAMGRTPEMIDYFQRMLGVPFPYEKYAQVCVPNFTNAGMENASATTLTDSILVDARQRLDENSDDLIAHELFHQWFGDLLTCDDWGEIWLNEGFATYSEALWMERLHGPDGLALAMRSNQDLARNASLRGRARPLVVDRYRNPNSLFDLVAYQKASCVIHMLRGEIGDGAWWEGLRTYVRENQFKNVKTDDLRRAMERAAGRDLAWFFEQWTTRPDVPVLRADWTHDPERGVLKVSVSQNQPGPPFRFSTRIEVYEEADRSTVVPVEISEASHVFEIRVLAKPRNVEIDSARWLLADWSANRSNDEWLHQLREGRTVLSRIEAARALALSDEPALRAVAAAWARERLPEARAEMIARLQPALDVHRPQLLVALDDPAPKVRGAALEILAAIVAPDRVEPDLEAALRAALANDDESAENRRRALRALATARVPDLDALVRAAAATKTPRDSLAIAALGVALRAKTPEALEIALEHVGPDRSRPVRRMAVTHLAERLADEPRARERFIELVDEPDPILRGLVVNALARARVYQALPKLRARDEADLDQGRMKNSLREAIRILAGPENNNRPNPNP